MCGRFTLRSNLTQFLLSFGADTQVEWQPRFNIAPTQQVAAIRSAADSTSRELAFFRWGLIPSWAKDPAIGNRMINARTETIAEKPSFKSALKRRRCLILADGFYEWRKQDKAKQPFYIRMKDEQPFVFAGLWERWSKADSPVESCTIITTTPNRLMAELHDRMPVILSKDDADAWLAPEVEEPKSLLPLLGSYPSDAMEAYPVSTIVNSPRNESSECVQPVI